MKKANKFILLFSVSALLSLTAAAKSPESTYIQNCAKSPEIPVPVAVVNVHPIRGGGYDPVHELTPFPPVDGHGSGRVPGRLEIPATPHELGVGGVHDGDRALGQGHLDR